MILNFALGPDLNLVDEVDPPLENGNGDDRDCVACFNAFYETLLCIVARCRVPYVFVSARLAQSVEITLEASPADSTGPFMLRRGLDENLKEGARAFVLPCEVRLITPAYTPF